MAGISGATGDDIFPKLSAQITQPVNVELPDVFRGAYAVKEFAHIVREGTILFR
jgi:hypothetical protein